MCHSGGAFQTNSLSNTLEVLTMAAEAIVHGMAQLMHQGV
jgi:hypothetical protein